jgi:hypothetical protein
LLNALTAQAISRIVPMDSPVKPASDGKYLESSENRHTSA